MQQQPRDVASSGENAERRRNARNDNIEYYVSEEDITINVLMLGLVDGMNGVGGVETRTIYSITIRCEMRGVTWCFASDYRLFSRHGLAID